MSAELYPNEPFFRGLLLQPFKNTGQPMFVNNLNAPDGPCELAIRKSEMPPFDSLADETRFVLGLAMRYIAASFDGNLKLTVDDALKLYGQLAEDIADWMDRNSAAAHSFDVDVLLDILLFRVGHLYDAAAFPSWYLRSRVHYYVSRFTPTLLHGKFPTEIERTTLTTLLANRTPGIKIAGIQPRAHDVEQACADLLESAPLLHVPAKVYDECERADWTGFYLNHGVIAVRAFRVIVDGETWIQAPSNPLIQLQTEWLIVDIRENVWKCYERVHQRNIHSGERGEVTWGAWMNIETREYGPIESQAYVPIDGQYHSLTCPTNEASRIFHVFASLMVLMQHPDVRIPVRARGRKAYLKLPAGKSVNRLIADMLHQAG